MKIEHC